MCLLKSPVEVGSLCLSYPIIYHGFQKHPTVRWLGEGYFEKIMAPEECEVLEAEELTEYHRRCALETEHQEP